MIAPAYAAKLGFKVQPINVKAQKIDSFLFKIFDMVLASFPIEDKLGQPRFFQETFLVANTSLAVILNMLFLTLSNAIVLFKARKLIWQF